MLRNAYPEPDVFETETDLLKRFGQDEKSFERKPDSYEAWLMANVCNKVYKTKKTRVGT